MTVFALLLDVRARSRRGLASSAFDCTEVKVRNCERDCGLKLMESMLKRVKAQMRRTGGPKRQSYTDVFGVTKS